MNYFPRSLTRNAFTWFTTLPLNWIYTWAQLERVFHEHFFRGETKVSLIDLETTKHFNSCRYLHSGGGATWDPMVRLPRKENAWSHHQRLFEEKVKKTKMEKRSTVCVFWKWGFESHLRMGKVLAPHMPVTRDDNL